MLQKINSAKLLPSAFSCQVYKNNQTGSIAVIIALSMAVLLTVLAFVIDTGYLYGAKNKYQNGVEAAAMAGAVSLCDDDPVGVARQIALENGLPADSITVQVGFYDEIDLYRWVNRNERQSLYGNFPEYKDFVAEGEAGYPEDEFNNAVMVKLNKDVDTLMGGFLGKNEVTVGAAAVAYLKRYSMVSLDGEYGDIRLSAKSFNNGDIYANGDIKMPTSPPEFNYVNLFAGGEVLECPKKTGPFGMPTNEIDWDAGSPSSLGNTFPNSPLIDDIRPLDDEHLNDLMNEADIVYNISDAGNDVIYGECNTSLGVHAYFFDLTGDHSSRITYFFDASGDNESGHPVVAYLSAIPTCSGSPIGHTPNGGSDIVKNITFIARCPVIVDHEGTGTTHFGGENDEQVIIISLSDITVYNSDLFLDGVYFRCGGNFKILPSHGASDYNKMRVIADGNIEIDYPSEYDFLFGPPCPPSIPKLGRLEATGS